MKRLLLALALALALFAPPSLGATKEVGPIVSNVVAVLTDADPVVIDASVAFTYSLSLGGNHAISTPTGQVAGSLYVFLITQSGSTRVPVWASGWRFPAATPPVLSTPSGSLDALLFVSDGTYMNYLSIQKDISSPVIPPSGLVITPGIGTCDLSWTDNSSDETSFGIYSCQDSGGPCDPTGSLIDSTSTNVHIYHDASGLGAPETYRYSIRAFRGSTPSTYSNVASCSPT